jgi:RNA polymerase sigma-70 factor (ECF subfamily)
MDTIPRTPASLLLRLREPSSQAAWERFVELYTPLLLRWANRLGLRGADCDDLVQDVFIVLMRELPKFEYNPDRLFRRWLKTVMRNKFCERERRQVLGADVGDAFLDEAKAPDPLIAAEDEEYRTYVFRQATTLMRRDFEEPTWRAFLELNAGRPAAEVAAELG